MSLYGTSREKGVYYGWYIVGASFLILFLNSGVVFSFGVVFKPIAAEFGWGRGPVSLAFFINMIVFALSTSAVGKLYDHYGPKWVILICSSFVTIGLFLTSLMTSLWQFFLFYGVLVAIGFGGTSIPLIGAMTSKWFVERRGLAVSLAIAGFSMGQFVLVPAFSFLALRYGWRLSYVVMGLITLVVNIPLALLIIKQGKPQAFGITPPGLEHDKVLQETDKGENQSAPFTPVKDMNLSQALRTRSYWLFMIVMFICGSHDFFITTHLIPFATDHGVSPATASNMLAWFGLMGLAGILIAGPVADLIGVKIPIILTFALRVAIFLLILRRTDVTSIYTFALAAGFTVLITAPLNPPLMVRLFGLSHVGLLAGVITTVHHLGGGFWAFAGGMIFDYTGGYTSVFVLSVATSALAVLCMALIK
ncbi:MAG TPA: MFS transporter, partial [Syntrophorhabdales bacterium]|nr:MFS transporter [Syntrophorhabdales bacterium]